MIGYEPLLDALEARLREDLPARLDTIAGEYGDGIALPAPAAYRKYANPEEANYPVVFLLPGEATTQEQTGDWLTAVREVLVVVMHREQGLPALSSALMRYERALMEAALGKQAPSPAHGIKWTKTAPGRLFELEDQPVLWQSWMTLHFELTVYEADRVS